MSHELDIQRKKRYTLTNTSMFVPKHEHGPEDRHRCTENSLEDRPRPRGSGMAVVKLELNSEVPNATSVRAN